MNIPEGAKAELCTWCNETSYNLAQHKQNCNNKHVRCYLCKKEFPVLFISAHARACKKDKKTQPKKKNKKKKGGGDDPQNDEDEEEGKKRKGSGRFFTLNFHGAKKYKIIKRLLTTEVTTKKKRGKKKKKGRRFVVKPWIKQLVLGNEFGSGPKPHSHCHAVVATTEKMNFEQFQENWKKETKIKIADLSRAKSFNKDVRYCTKEDYRPILVNIDWDLTSVMCRAYQAARKYTMLTHRTYPYCNLPSWMKGHFKQHFVEFREMEQQDNLRFMSENVVLRPWQERFMRFLNWHDSQREIIWVVDQIGNTGKTFLSFYLQDQEGAMRVPNVSSKDFAYAYNFEKVVIFDYERDAKEHINYRILENLKNGSIWSPKYESRSKNFRDTRVKVVCFANYPPQYDRLSADRWVVFNIENGKLKRVKIPDQLTLHLPVDENSQLFPDAEPPAEPPIEVEVDPPLPNFAYPVASYMDSRFIVIENQ